MAFIRRFVFEVNFTNALEADRAYLSTLIASSDLVHKFTAINIHKLEQSAVFRCRDNHSTVFNELDNLEHLIVSGGVYMLFYHKVLTQA